MVSTQEESPAVSGMRLSSVVPASATGEDKVHYELTNIDLAMKLHYLRGLYLFQCDAVHGLTILDLKSLMFHWLDLYYQASGRIRRSEEEEEKDQRPFIRCNDSGVRIGEAQCNKTLEEWMIAMKDDYCINDQLIYNQVLGPELGFSPLVFIQFTWFKCGGLSLGLSWAHILGDIFSASSFINMWGHFMAGQVPPKSLNMPKKEKYQLPPTILKKPLSLKMVNPVGDYWLNTNNCKMETHCFHISGKQLNTILSKFNAVSEATKVRSFDILSALVWKCLAKVRGESEPRIVTICGESSSERENEIPSNGQEISIVEADFVVANANLFELAKLIGEKNVDERRMIKEFVERESEKSDYIIYGANLTFVNLEDEDIYELKLKGHKPIFTNYTISGVGEEGVVLVLPELKNGGMEGENGRKLTVTLPESQISELKNELRKEWGVGII